MFSSQGSLLTNAMFLGETHIPIPKTLRVLRQNLYSCPQYIREAVYKGRVHPVLEYGSSVWDPQAVLLQGEIERMQNHAAKSYLLFATGNYNY